MKRLYLASSINFTAKAIAKDIGKKGLKLTFIKTAAEVEEGPFDWLDNDRKGLVDAGFEVSDFTFTGKNRDEVEKALKRTDVIHINGGNTFYLLEKIMESGADKIIKNLVENGKIYIGSSAGSIVAGPDIYPARGGDDIGVVLNLKNYRGLGLVDFVVLPHWGSETFRISYVDKKIDNIYSESNKMILLNNYQYIKVVNDMYKIEEISH